MNPLGRTGRRWVWILTLVAGIFCASAVLVPVAEHHGLWWARWTRLAFRPTCHQIPERCLDLGAGPLAVCARCAGLYVGGFVGLLLTAVCSRRMRPQLQWVVVAAVPSVVDFAIGIVGGAGLANWPRFVLATVPGLLLGLLLADAVAQLADGSGEQPPRIT